MKKNDEYLVTAIVSTYNSEKYITNCINDLLSQTIVDRLEIIVVDAKSEQQEGKIVEKFCINNKNIKYVRLDYKETIYGAWNIGVELAKGKYITNANTDDRHRVDALELMANVLEEDSSISLVYSDVAVTVKENSNFNISDIVGYYKWPNFDPKLLFKVCYVGPQPMWRKELHDKYGYFDKQLKSAGDYEYWLRLSSGGVKFYHLPEVLGLYLSSPSGVENSDKSTSYLESEFSRDKYWNQAWGKRPSVEGYYFVPALPKNPLFSIIIPTRNRPELLHSALQSVLLQDYPTWEAIVVNDGGESIKDLVEALDPEGRIRCIEHQSACGCAAARNTALRSAQGDVICYLDDDDLYHPHHLSTVLNALREDPDALVYTDSEFVVEEINDGQRVEVSRRKHIEHSMDHSVRPRECLYVQNFIPINAWAHSRRAIDSVGYFDEKLASHEDWEYLLRLTRNRRIIHVPEATVEVRQRNCRVDNITRLASDANLSVYKEIYKRFNDIRTDFVVKGRIALLGEIDQRPFSRLARSLKTKGKLYAERYVLWRFSAPKH